jgi:hypothetical protein
MLLTPSPLPPQVYIKEGRGGEHLVRKIGDCKPCSMPLGSLLLSSIGKSGAILTIYMALHQAVRTAGKSTENRLAWSLGELENSREIHTHG